MTTSIKTLVLETLDNLKALQVNALDVRRLTPMMDTLIIATGNSNRHVRSMAEHIICKLKKTHCSPLGVEGKDAAEWILIDLGEVVVHIMLAKTREFYGLEKLWRTKPLTEAELLAIA